MNILAAIKREERKLGETVGQIAEATRGRASCRKSVGEFSWSRVIGDKKASSL